MVVLLDSSGSMRVVPQVWNDMGNYPYSYSAMVDLGFTAEGLLWISDDRGIFYYDRRQSWRWPRTAAPFTAGTPQR